ncbi:PREDICTED: uncharacterized protein LOC105456172 [Wasmannia auropunctata]|uniref:uncharacterized protein LOC105456172 n=1 Tax=Wasmannia auropunctata TaxID=64793 RepID=UPI0005EFBECB|nr:PREDICTED: uncharacterized protein LOC105456172 [Wasmannia auropunctata]XP_011698438.1 PREDICTED: uncharacterized protein LOC105456172 [Wasmannia auropunctata]
MSDERAHAISVVNRFALLVEGMIPGFKDHLAEDVVLKWFGKVQIRGRKNVAAFLLSNKMETFHMFSNITPISGISYESKRSNRKIKQSTDQNANCETYTDSYSHEAPACSSYKTEMSTTHENVKDCDQKSNGNYAAFVCESASNGCEFQKMFEETEDLRVEKCLSKLKISTNCDHMNSNNDVNKNEFSANATAEMDGLSYDLNENDLYNLFEPEITSQSVVDKIQNINRIKLKEEMAPTVSAINRECGQGDEPVTAEANATKYLEASGEIKFVRSSTQTDSMLSYHWSKLGQKKVWKKRCNVQMAYSLLNDLSKAANKCDNAQENSCSTCISNLSARVDHSAGKIQKSKLPSLEEVIQTNDALIRDVNYFGGYLYPVNFSKDREELLEMFKEKSSNVDSCVHYVDNKWVFHVQNKKPFNVTYQIHELVYSKVKVKKFDTCGTAQVKNITLA